MRCYVKIEMVCREYVSVPRGTLKENVKVKGIRFFRIQKFSSRKN